MKHSQVAQAETVSQNLIRRHENKVQRAKRELREADERTISYEKVRQRFIHGLEAQAPILEATFAGLADLMQGWFTHMQGFDQDNFHGDCMLVVTELAEAVEADRTDAASDKVPEFHGREEEIADALVRLFHLCGKYDLKIGPAFVAKMRYNFNRPFKHGKDY